MPNSQCPFCNSNVMMSDDKKQWCPKCGKGTMLEPKPDPHPDQRACPKCENANFPDYEYVKKRRIQELKKKVAEERMAWPIHKLQPSVRMERVLYYGKIRTVGDLVQLGRRGVLLLKDCGQVALREMIRKLRSIGLDFDMELHDFSDEDGRGCFAECPPGEHLHISCGRCGFYEWQHCADHVEARESVNDKGEKP